MIGCAPDLIDYDFKENGAGERRDITVKGRFITVFMFKTQLYLLYGVYLRICSRCFHVNLQQVFVTYRAIGNLYLLTKLIYNLTLVDDAFPLALMGFEALADLMERSLFSRN